MSSHYIHLTCPAPDCAATGSIYTGSLEADGFEQALDYEGETITARCDEHAGWVAPDVEEPSKHTESVVANAIASWMDGEFDDGLMLQYGASVNASSDAVVDLDVFDPESDTPDTPKRFRVTVTEATR